MVRSADLLTYFAVKRSPLSTRLVLAVYHRPSTRICIQQDFVHVHSTLFTTNVHIPLLLLFFAIQSLYV